MRGPFFSSDVQFPSSFFLPPLSYFLPGFPLAGSFLLEFPLPSKLSFFFPVIGKFFLSFGTLLQVLPAFSSPSWHPSSR